MRDLILFLSPWLDVLTAIVGLCVAICAVLSWSVMSHRTRHCWRGIYGLLGVSGAAVFGVPVWSFVGTWLPLAAADPIITDAGILGMLLGLALMMLLDRRGIDRARGAPAQQKSQQRGAVDRKGLIALVGVSCAGVLCTYVPQFEGKILRGYKDPIGIVTACSGHTATAVLGKPYTESQCEQLLIDDLVSHAAPVLKCTPQLEGHPQQLAAAISFAFNIGAGAYCNSSTARRFRVGDFAGACRAMNEADDGRPQWVSAGTRLIKMPDGTAREVPNVLPGLVKRRAVERALCEGRLAPAANDAAPSLKAAA